MNRKGKPDMQVRKRLGLSEKVRKVVKIEHCSPDIHYIVHNSCVVNLERAVKERVFFIHEQGEWIPTPSPSESHFNNTLLSFTNELHLFLPRATPIERSKFADLYSGRLRERYAAASDSLLYRTMDKNDARVKSFVKAEKINQTAKPDPVPRLIQPRDPRYGVELGRFIKILEKQLYVSIKKVFGSTTVFKGLNAKESGNALHAKWKRFSKPVAVGLDAKRFDQHVSVAALKWEHEMYIKCFSQPRHKKLLRKLLKYQLKTFGSGFCRDGSVKYTVEGKRCSGDMNTGLGNCLLMCAMVWAYAKMRGVNIELANNGDDCVVMLESDQLSDFSLGLDAWFRDMGFRMTVEEPVYEFEQIEFCQTHPVMTHDGYLMVRNITTGIAKDCISTVYNNTIQSLYSYYRVIGDAGLHLTGGVPIWQNFYRRLIDCVPEGRMSHMIQHETGMINLAARMKRKFSPPTPEARFSFWLAFSITPDEQIEMEKHYDNVEFNWTDLKTTLYSSYIPFFPGI